MTYKVFFIFRYSNFLPAKKLCQIIKFKDTRLGPSDSLRMRVTDLKDYLEAIPASRNVSKPLFGVTQQVLFVNEETSVCMTLESWEIIYKRRGELYSTE
jgi:hypothetical protein